MCNHMDEPRRHYAMQNELITERQILHAHTYVGYLK